VRRLAVALLLLTAAVPTPTFGKMRLVVVTPYASAVAATERSAESRAMDASRKPAEVLAFSQLKPGMRALDLLAGNGYYSEIMARVVGPKGNVVAFSPATYMDGKSRDALMLLAARHKNLAYTGDLPAEFSKAEQFDFTLLHLNYHDFYFESVEYKVPRTEPAVVLSGLFHATKPGGIVAVVDHVGLAGDTRAIVDKLHRIDPATVKADFARAGFVLDGESDLLRVPSDDHSKNVFDPSIRGKTDRMALRFRKPLK
jgi:predicted methyltransferase